MDKVEEFSEQCLQVLDIAGAREHSVEFPKGEKPPDLTTRLFVISISYFCAILVCQQRQMLRVICPKERV